MIRGIERTAIFRNDEDRESFLDRIGETLLESSTPCYAWSLLGNHVHFLLSTGKIPIARVMRKVLTGYAVTFNRRYRRSGHLFQNRYKSILCEEDVYLRELVRYIHLNPLRAGVVKDLRELGSYGYSGHSVLMGKNKREWQDRDYVLRYFGQTEREAQEEWEWRALFRKRGLDLKWLVEEVACHFGVDSESLRSGSKVPNVAKARAFLCCVGVRGMGLTAASIAKDIGISPSAVSRAISRASKVMQGHDIEGQLLECQ